MFDTKQIPDDVLGVCRHLSQAGHQAHLVGGGVRDLLLGRRPADFDVATNALPDVVLRLFGSRYAIPTGLQHGTITVLAGTPARHVEVTTFRGEGEYLDGRRPSSVSFSATLEEDLARRDFTMNAIAFDPLSGRLTDPFAGQAALAQRMVKAVGDPIKRFTEDGLRPMRAIRQATQLGFTVDPPTLAAITLTIGSFRQVSAERIRDELVKMFGAAVPSGGIRLMQETELLGEVFPELLACVGIPDGHGVATDVFEHSLAVLDALPARFDLRLAGLWHDVAKATVINDDTGREHARAGAQMVARMADRLRLSVAEKRLVCDLVGMHEFPYSASDSDADVRRLLRGFCSGADRIDDLLTLHVANLSTRHDARDEAGAFVRRARAVRDTHPPLRPSDLALDGQALMKSLGIGPGRQVGTLLAALLDHVVEDPRLNTTDELVAIAKDLLAAPTSAPS